VFRILIKLKQTLNYKINFGLFISKNRKNYFFQRLNKLAIWFIKNYENFNYSIETNGENYVMKYLELKPNAVVFDVGFNEGEWSEQLLRQYPQINLFGFDPQVELIVKAKVKFESAKNVTLFQFGLSDKTENTEIFIYQNHSFLSGIYNHPHGIPTAIQNVSMRKGSEIFNQLKLQHIDLLKIDVEGAEHFVLKGFQEILMMKKIIAIQFEYGKGSINSKFLLKDYYEYLEPLGFKIGKIYPNYIDFKTYNWDDENFLGPNYLAVLKNHL